jgi:hypothetical protein
MTIKERQIRADASGARKTTRKEPVRWSGWLSPPSIVGGVASIGDVLGVRTWHDPGRFSQDSVARALAGDLERVGRDGWSAIAAALAEEPELRGQQTLFDAHVFSRPARRTRRFGTRFRL